MISKTCIVTAVLYLIAIFLANGEKPKSRPRRSWIMPGTLWCGAGSTAENFTNLGVFHGVDRCCREHDHCFPQIQAFEFRYGIRNYRLHTVSHCDCDQRFRQCLHTINDTISTIVGKTYFNILEMPCFSLRDEEQCVEWFWWGGCKSNGTIPKAELHKPDIFNDSIAEDSHTFVPILHKKDGQRVGSRSRTHALLSLHPSLASNAKSRRGRLKKLQREQIKRYSQRTLKESPRAEEKFKKLKVKSKQLSKH